MAPLALEMGEEAMDRQREKLPETRRAQDRLSSQTRRETRDGSGVPASTEPASPAGRRGRPVPVVFAAFVLPIPAGRASHRALRRAVAHGVSPQSRRMERRNRGRQRLRVSFWLPPRGVWTAGKRAATAAAVALRTARRGGGDHGAVARRMAAPTPAGNSRAGHLPAQCLSFPARRALLHAVVGRPT